MAKNYLRACGFDFKEINIRSDPAALALMKEQGHQQTPQIYVGSHLLVQGGNEGLQRMSRDEIAQRVSELSE